MRNSTRKELGDPCPWTTRAITLLPASVICAGLCLQAALAAPGDLDPAFGEAGRFAPSSGYSGPALSVTPRGDGGVMFSGGSTLPRRTLESPRNPDVQAVGFVGRLSDTGLPDPGFSASEEVRIFDTAVQPDGKVIAAGEVGLPIVRYGSNFDVFRLERDGTRDAGFAWPRLTTFAATRCAATSVLMEPDGRIVVAGYGRTNLVVQRLLPDGTLDPAFGDTGTFEAAELGRGRPVVVAAGGGYRVLAQDAPGTVPRCRVLALTAGGQVDSSYAQQGFAGLGAPASASVTCRSLAALPDGRLQVVGVEDGRAFAVRLGIDGAVDPGFDGRSVAAAMSDANGVAVAADGGSIVAGQGASGESGVRVLRLRPDGVADDRFGVGGTSWIDLQDGVANDVELLPDGGVLVAGGAIASDGALGPFVARLLGDAGGSSPGVLGFKWSRIVVGQDGPRAALTVWRTGGRTGALSVAYRTRARTGPSSTGALPATESVDYDPVSGTLRWSDGDTSEQQVLLPVSADAGAPEGPEAFDVELHAADGASAIGTAVATVEIAADGAPAGLLTVDPSSLDAGEGQGAIQVAVKRGYYSSGAVSVTLTPRAGSALAGQDYAGDPVTVSWADGESDVRWVDIAILDDAVQEQAESFTVELSGATGGAVIGTNAAVTITIADDDSSGGGTPPPAGGSGPASGGGGSPGWLTFALLAMTAGRRGTGFLNGRFCRATGARRID